MVRLLILLAVLTGLGAGGWIAWDRILRSAPVVRVVRVVSPAAAQKSLDASGYLVPQRRAEVATKAAGIVGKVYVEEGDTVKAGQPLAELANGAERAQLDEARVLLEEAGSLRDQAARAQDESASQKTQAESARAEAESLKEQAARARDEAAARLEEAKRDYERKKKLRDTKDVGDAEFEAAEAAYKATEARLAGAEAGLAAAGSRWKTADSGASAALSRFQSLEAAAKAAENRRRAAETRVTQAEIRLDDTIIRSPIDGRVTARKIQPGEAASPAGIVTGTRGGALFTVADFSTLEAEVDIGEARLAELRERHPARIAVDAVPGRKYRGELRQIVPMADRTRAVVKVRVRLLDADAQLLPDMGLRVSFLAGDASVQESAGPLIPQGAVLSAGGRTFVWLVADGKAASRDVTLGKKDGANVEVTSGLSGGEAVIVGNDVTLREGMRVQAEEK